MHAHLLAHSLQRGKIPEFTAEKKIKYLHLLDVAHSRGAKASLHLIQVGCRGTYFGHQQPLTTVKTKAIGSKRAKGCDVPNNLGHNRGISCYVGPPQSMTPNTLAQQMSIVIRPLVWYTSLHMYVL